MRQTDVVPELQPEASEEVHLLQVPVWRHRRGLPGAERAEDLLLPWAERLFERIDALTRSQVASELERVRGRVRRRPEDAIKRIDLRLERITELYAMGHWEKDRYVQERARLEEDRRQLENQAEPERALKLEGVLDGWRGGDPVVRRALVGALFEELYVKEGKIVGWKARTERAAEAERLMDEVGAAGEERSA